MHKMANVGFLILFGLSCVLFLCEGQNVSPPSNKSIIVLPGSTARLKWTFVGDPSKATLSWFFIRRGGSKNEELAVKFRTTDAIIQNSSLPGVAIETPATLVLKNVDERYNGKYKLNVQVAGGGGEAEVDVFIAVTPNVTFSCSSPITVNEGDNFTCVCRGEGGNPPANVTWYKDGVQIGGTGKEEQTLTVRNVSGTDNGTYKCLAQSHINATDEKSIEIIVKLNFKPKNTTITFTKNPAVVGGNVAVMCNSSGLPEPSYTIIDNDNKIVSNKSVNSTYIIDDVQLSDAGTYKCIALNKLGAGPASDNLTVGQIYLPPGGNNLTFLKEPIVKIMWSLDPILSTNISRSWSFKPRGSGKDEILGKVSRTGDITIITSLYEVDIEKPATLVLKNVDERYNGAYKFTLYPGLPGPGISEVEVFIAKKPDVRIHCPRRITLDEGENRTCVCTEQGGNPRANLTWYKDDRQIDEATYGENRLTLTSVTKQDIGTYKCVAQSYTLTDEESIEVNVTLNFKPKDTTIMITPKDAEVGQSVTIKCDSKGLPKPKYKIAHGGKMFVVIPGHEKSHTILDVQLNQAGRYDCIAWNQLGNHSAFDNLTVVEVEGEDDPLSTGAIIGIVIGVLVLLVIVIVVVCRYKSKEKDGYRGNADVSPGASAGIPVNHYELDEEPDGGVDNAYDTVNNPGASGSKSKPPANTNPDVYAAVDKKNREGKPLYATLDSLALQADNSKKKRDEERPGQTEYASIDFAKIGKADQE